MSNRELRHLACVQEGEIQGLNAQIVVLLMSAHYRSGKTPAKVAAAFCNMTEDNFMRAQTILDTEALQVIGRGSPPDCMMNENIVRKR